MSTRQHKTLVDVIYLTLHKLGYLNVGDEIKTEKTSVETLADTLYLTEEEVRETTTFGSRTEAPGNFKLTIVTKRDLYGITSRMGTLSFDAPEEDKPGTIELLLDQALCKTTIGYKELCSEYSPQTIDFKYILEPGAEHMSWLAIPHQTSKTIS